MIFKELNDIQCKCYLIACAGTRKAMIIDPEREYLDRYLAVLAYHGLTLDAIVDTHTHADHLSGGPLLKTLTDARLIMHTTAPSPRVNEHVVDGDVIRVGDLEARVLHTPGHTPDSISLYVMDRVFTGDVILIGGTGRTDFAGGDSGQQYDSIVNKLFTLPDETLLYPAHDYRGNTVSTIGEEKANNPRIAGRSRQEYIDLMASIEFPLPGKIQEVLQPNQTAIDDDIINYPSLAQLSEVKQMDSQQVVAALQQASPPALIDVREPDEYNGELGHIPDSQLIPLKELPGRAEQLSQLKETPVVVICRSGVRSTTAAAILTALGYRQVSNLKGGMVDWNAREFPVQRN